MVVRIRLSRFGCKNKPFYRVMAADSRSPRDGKHLEVLGYYNPLPGQDGQKRMGLNFDRVKRGGEGRSSLKPKWGKAGLGAQPSDPVQRILFRAGLLPPPPMVAMGRKGGPRDTRPVDPMTGRVLPSGSPSAAESDSSEIGDDATEPIVTVQYYEHQSVPSAWAGLLVTHYTKRSRKADDWFYL
ncbi:hypothetical protein Cgig2_000656 [Carnegiea gigantea]|uniref:Ribosomal protein S16 n=1 Tax=Carnegiea gigantea TaxID=171969 RepID=A0A9Q1JKG0_9CARY|nr:hypothetical protein Cgig2_000656 [Carnegiea gigantea]